MANNTRVISDWLSVFGGERVESTWEAVREVVRLPLPPIPGPSPTRGEGRKAAGLLPFPPRSAGEGHPTRGEGRKAAPLSPSLLVGEGFGVGGNNSLNGL